MSTKSGSPPKESTPPAASFNEQMQIMQSLMEVQRELSALSTKADRLISDVDKLDNSVGDLSRKIGRFEAVAATGGVMIVVFSGFLWWLIGPQITQLRDQVIRLEQNQPAQNSE